MSQVTIKWVEKLQFVGTDSTKHSVVLSAPNEENGTGMKPGELLLVSLGSCTAYDVANILQKQRKQLHDLRIEVSSKSQEHSPWAYTHIHLHYIVVGEGISERDVAKAIHLSHEKYCSVSATLRAAVEITHDYKVLQPGETPGQLN
ncbi:MAG: OsmC family protein [Chloroflexi bacterium]|nr:OsmC family protein [Chloroflexota bacterium]